MLDRFTDRARNVLANAIGEARRSDLPYVGTEHLLSALLQETDALAVRILVSLDVSLSKVRQAVAAVRRTAAQAKTVSEAGYTLHVQKALEAAMTEARSLGHGYVGTEHLLLGLLRGRSSAAARVLTQMGVSLADARAAALRLLNDAAEELQAAAPDEFAADAAEEVDRADADEADADESVAEAAESETARGPAQPDAESAGLRTGAGGATGVGQVPATADAGDAIERLIRRRDPRVAALEAAKKQAVATDAFESAARLRDELVSLIRAKAGAVEFILAADPSFAALVMQVGARLGHGRVSAAELILALLHADRQLAERLGPHLEAVRKACHPAPR